MNYEFNSINQIWSKSKETIELYFEIELDGNPELASNCVAETYMALLAAMNEELGIIDPKRWLMITAHNILCLSTEKPSSLLVSNSKNELVDDCLSKLSSSYRDILIKRYRKRLPICNIAKEYNVTEATMIQRLRRAKSKYLSTAIAYEKSKNNNDITKPKQPKSNKKYRIGTNCIVDISTCFFYTDSLEKEKRNIRTKAWKVLSALVERSLNEQYIPSTEIGSIYFSKNECEKWSRKILLVRAGTVIRNINKFVGEKIIINELGKGYKLAMKPELITETESEENYVY